MTATFSRLKQLKITADRTAKLTLDTVDTGARDADGKPLAPSLEVRFAGEANVAFHRAFLKVLNEQRATVASSGVTIAKQDAMRAAMVKLYADHIVAGWTNVLEDAPGGGLRASECTPENVLAFLTGLLENNGVDVWLAISSFASNEDNFRDAPATTGADLGKP